MGFTDILTGGNTEGNTDITTGLTDDSGMTNDDLTGSITREETGVSSEDSKTPEQKLEEKKRKEYQEKISEDRTGFILHQGEILETHTYETIFSTSWNSDYEGMSSDGSITIPFHKEDLKYIYKGVRCLLKTKRFNNFDEKIEIDDSDGYLCFITDVNISDNKLEISLSGYEKLLEQENILSFKQQRRSTILAEVIKMAGLIPVIDTTGLPDEIINWSTEKEKDKESTSSGNVSVDGDGSMTEEEAWKIASSWGYGGSCSSHEPEEAWKALGTNTGVSPDCYGATAWLYYVFNMKVGIPARDICYHSDYASSGSHHTIQLYRNGQWEDPAEYDQLTTNLKVIKSRDKSKDHISREPPENGKIPSYQKCPHSNNG